VEFDRFHPNISYSCRDDERGLPNPGFKSASDLAGLTADKGAGLTMIKIKSARRVPQRLLEAGRVWRIAKANLQVGKVGKLLVHYKLGGPECRARGQFLQRHQGYREISQGQLGGFGLSGAS
jgi:hypothetical protein